MWIFYLILRDIRDTRESVRIEYGEVFIWKIALGMTIVILNIIYVYFVMLILFESI